MDPNLQKYPCPVCHHPVPAVLPASLPAPGLESSQATLILDVATNIFGKRTQK